MRHLVATAIAATLVGSPAWGQLTNWDLQEARFTAATVVGGSLIAIAGGSSGSATSDLVEVRALDGALLDQWTLSIPRCRHGGAFVNGRFYFVGGTVPPFNLVTDRIDSFDVFGDLDRLTLPIVSGASGVVGFGDLLMVCGGFNFFHWSSGRYASRIQILDTATDTWSHRSIPFVTASADATDRWVVVAGNDSIIPGNGAFEVYDGLHGTWRNLRGQYLPLRPDLVVIDDAAYMFSTSNMDSFGLRLDLTDLSLQEIPLSQGRELPRLAAADHIICRANGRVFGESGLSRTADLYDTLTKEWHEIELAHEYHQRAPATDRSSGTAIFAGGAGTTQPFGRAGVDLITAERNLHSVVCDNQDANSTGQAATLRASGVRTAEVNLFSLIADGLPANSFGGALVSSVTVSPMSLGSAIGGLCLGAPMIFVQANPLRADATGRMTVGLDLAALPFSMPVSVPAGSTWYFQSWYRDRGPNGAVTRLTDGVSVLFE